MGVQEMGINIWVLTELIQRIASNIVYTNSTLISSDDDNEDKLCDVFSNSVSLFNVTVLLEKSISKTVLSYKKKIIMWYSNKVTCIIHINIFLL